MKHTNPTPNRETVPVPIFTIVDAGYPSDAPSFPALLERLAALDGGCASDVVSDVESKLFAGINKILRKPKDDRDWNVIHALHLAHLESLTVEEALRRVAAPGVAERLEQLTREKYGDIATPRTVAEEKRRDRETDRETTFRVVPSLQAWHGGRVGTSFPLTGKLSDEAITARAEADRTSWKRAAYRTFREHGLGHVQATRAAAAIFPAARSRAKA